MFIRFDDEETENGEEKKDKQPSLMEKMLKTRTILIYGGIDQKMAQKVTEQLLMLEADDDEAPIKLFINSQGGHVESGYTIFDMIRYVRPRVKIIGTGWAASAGALIYAAVDTEDRYSLPHTRYMLHQPLGGVRGQASDIAIEAEEIMKMRENLNQLFAVQTGQPIERVRKDTDRNFWMSAEEAMAYGLVGKIINTAADLDAE